MDKEGASKNAQSTKNLEMRTMFDSWWTFLTVRASASAYFHFFRMPSLGAYNVYLRVAFEDAW